MPQHRATDAFTKPIYTDVRPPEPNPLDQSTLLRTASHNSLAADDITEEHTTPEASFSNIELEPDTTSSDSLTNTDADATSQSTLSGSTFHTTKPNTDLADSDESQKWQIEATERGTNTQEH